MPSISGESSAAYSVNANRAEFASSAIRQANEQDRQVADRLEEAQETTQQTRREARQIPGLGNAVDITA
ncbi:hypothetical protein [Roseibium sp.]|uniref:hypothetical protein n=1 Tax=Roseibium sp. TaxID=1936156 RepID=UPI003A97753B